MENKICSRLKALYLKKSIGRTLLGHKDSAACPSFTDSVETTRNVESEQQGELLQERNSSQGNTQLTPAARRTH